MKAVSVATSPELSIDPTVVAQINTVPRLLHDIRSWWVWRNDSELVVERAFISLFHAFPEFRSLVHYRFRRAGLATTGLPQLRLTNDLYLATDDIGGGFRIQHGHSTWVLAESIGEDCHINQNATVGVSKGGKPRIGNRVKICTGAVVIGPITIGDDVVIAPNAVVDFDVPAGKKVFPPRSVIV